MELEDCTTMSTKVVYYGTTVGISSLSGWKSSYTGTPPKPGHTHEKAAAGNRVYVMSISLADDTDTHKPKNIKRRTFREILHHLKLTDKINSICSVLFKKKFKNRPDPPELLPVDDLTDILLQGPPKIQEAEDPDTLKYKRIYDQMLTIIESRKLFLDPRLTQADLIKYVGTNRKYLYNALKQNNVENFKDLLNYYRLKLAKSIIDYKIITGETLILSEVHSRCGFSTNESFYRIFKNAMGYTPGHYAENVIHCFNTVCKAKCQQKTPCPLEREYSECLLKLKETGIEPTEKPT